MELKSINDYHLVPADYGTDAHGTTDIARDMPFYYNDLKNSITHSWR